MSMNARQGAWLSDTNVSNAEIVATLGYDFVTLDVEHGAFDLAGLERFIPVLKGLGLEVLSKVLVPERGAIQQALDFGSDGVIIPHIRDAAHAAEITAFAKYAPLGNRSLAGGRTMGYKWYDDAWIEQQNRTIKVLPLIEEPAAVAEIDEILALPTVDGVFIGPGDLALLQGRGAYRQTPADFEDFERILAAVRANDKQWGMPGWTQIEREWAAANGADWIILVMQHAAVYEGFAAARSRMAAALETGAHRSETPAVVAAD